MASVTQVFVVVGAIVIALLAVASFAWAWSLQRQVNRPDAKATDGPTVLSGDVVVKGALTVDGLATMNGSATISAPQPTTIEEALDGIGPDKLPAAAKALLKDPPAKHVALTVNGISTWQYPLLGNLPTKDVPANNPGTIRMWGLGQDGLFSDQGVISNGPVSGSDGSFGSVSVEKGIYAQDVETTTLKSTSPSLNPGASRVTSAKPRPRAATRSLWTSGIATN